MTTTALVVEIIVVGVLSILSVAPVVALVVPTSLTAIAYSVGQPSPLVTLPLAYAAGVVWNRVCDAVFRIPDQRLLMKYFASREAMQAMRVAVVHKSEQLDGYLAAQRGLVRVARAAALLPVPLAAVVVARFNDPHLLDPYVASLPSHSAAILIACLVSSALACFAWHRLRAGYFAALVDADAVTRNPADGTGAAPSAASRTGGSDGE